MKRCAVASAQIVCVLMAENFGATPVAAHDGVLVDERNADASTFHQGVLLAHDALYGVDGGGRAVRHNSLAKKVGQVRRVTVCRTVARVLHRNVNRV
ncbi:hypothetical protein D3C80_1690930 [compost metagenome]